MTSVDLGVVVLTMTTVSSTREAARLRRVTMNSYRWFCVFFIGIGALGATTYILQGDGGAFVGYFLLWGFSFFNLMRE